MVRKRKSARPRVPRGSGVTVNWTEQHAIDRWRQRFEKLGFTQGHLERLVRNPPKGSPRERREPGNRIIRPVHVDRPDNGERIAAELVFVVDRWKTDSDDGEVTMITGYVTGKPRRTKRSG